jgi:GNAT superfamily N-acetyltransferase
MALTVEHMPDRPRPDDQMAALFADGWPAFITADQEVKKHFGAVRELFADLELVLLDPGDVIVAAGWSVPIRWSGDPVDLPGGYTGSLARAVSGHRRGERPDTLVIAAAQVHPDHRGRGVAGELLTALRELAGRRGWTRVIAPVRPTLKARYPLTSIEEFASWTRPDGAPLDPWLRTHWRLGARIIGTAPGSQTMTGTVADWETWTGMRFPASGEYVIPGGLATLHVDRDTDRGIYVEPNVWMQHRDPETTGRADS